MNANIRQLARREDGMVLITSLLLLLVVTILALAMFRGVGLENRIAGNVMDKQRALQAATSSADYAEQWLFNNVSTAVPTTCAASSFTATTSPTICSNTILTATGTSALVVPWGGAASALGYTYNPITTGTTTLFPVSTAGGVDNYYQAPTVYVADLGSDATYANATDYQIDAWSYGGSTGTVAVVESVYQIRYIAAGGGGP
ncbi:MAG TPA: PilX N-terminal domain-containing pilus assembly protein [Steroidobacteraceae bacterium]|nr:PilX N-terminal domain-containing pilus assembly protein [Steroidobacteraceae bacterium]